MRRLATKDVTLPDHNITIRRGQTVSVDSYRLHRPERLPTPRDLRLSPLPPHARAARRRQQSTARDDEPRAPGFRPWTARVPRPVLRFE
ncbi:hypothetical protein CSAL01_07463 [Colletotrichum salicis]|uniref:Uncharacterized protein n=1 Tax=Colletotrichum salicis TaxID=1209931 RepID=A0A135UAW1_9PEZI|nr:hypothetical protein CSAL01_07463 [Colletotrichum salicis]